MLLAEGINLGLRKMAEATTTHGFWELMHIARWHVEGDAFARALAVVVEAQAALPMVVVLMVLMAIALLPVSTAAALAYNVMTASRPNVSATRLILADWDMGGTRLRPVRR